jgi:aspartate carbamoyltransferase regulatory subunit
VRELKVTPIRNGTVIDHLPAGSALKICQVLGIPKPGSASTVSVVLNVDSDSMGLKDLIKVEDRDLREEDLARLAVLAPDATVNTIRDYHVAEKTEPEVPDTVTDLVPCPNGACVTHDDEPVPSEFQVRRNGGVELSCAYCVEPLEDPLGQVPW